MCKYQDVIILNNNLEPEKRKGLNKRCKIALLDGGVGELELAYVKNSKYKMYELITGLFCLEATSIKQLDNLLEAGFGIRIYKTLISPHMNKYREKIQQYRYNKLIKKGIGDV